MSKEAYFDQTNISFANTLFPFNKLSVDILKKPLRSATHLENFRSPLSEYTFLFRFEAISPSVSYSKFRQFEPKDQLSTKDPAFIEVYL